MTFESDRKDFLTALGDAAKAVCGKQMNVLGNVFLKASGERVDITGYNLSLAVFSTVPADVSEPGEALLNPSDVAAFLNKCREEKVSVSACADQVTIRCGKSKVTMSALHILEFPQPKRVSEEENEITLEADGLRQMVGAVIYAAADISPKTALQSVNFRFSEAGVTLTACDGYRASTCHRPVDGICAEQSFNVVKSDLKTALKIIVGSRITIRFDRERLEFIGADGTAVLTRLFTGDYPDVEANIRMSFEAVKEKIHIDADRLRDTLGKILALPKESVEPPTRLCFGTQSATIIYDFKTGKFIEDIDCTLDGNPITLGVRASFLLEALQQVGGAVFLGCNGATGAITMEGNGIRQMLMPMRILNGLS